jgi:hypothetical protein
MMELFNDIVIRCSSCGEVIVLNKDDYEPDIYSYDHGENGMGEEIEYIFQDEIVCSCRNRISFRISGFEYPIGAFDFESSEIFGGEFEEKPHMGVIYYAEDFDVSVAELEYARIHTLIMQISEDKELLYSVTPREFEQIVESVFNDAGFETVLTPATRDGGKDIIATKYVMGKPVVFYIECKRYGRGQKVGVAVVQRLYGVQTDDKINKAVLVTTSRFTSGARRFAEKQKTLIDLFDIDDFHALLQISADKYRRKMLYGD